MNGQILKKLRARKNLTLEQLADIFIKKYSTGTTKSLISKWEKNLITPTNQSLQMYCDYFNVSMDYLYGYTDIPHIVKNDNGHKSEEDIISTLTPEQQTELNFLVKQYATMLMASVNSATEKDKKELIRVVTVAYLKSIGKIKEV